MKKVFKTCGIIFFMYVFLCFIVPFNSFLRNRSIENQIFYLAKIIDNGYDNEIQRRFPEGKLFSNAILALSIIEYCDNESIVNPIFSEMVDNCILRIESDENKATYDVEMIPKYGMFYNGWSNLVYSNYKKSVLYNHSSISSIISHQSNIIESRFFDCQSDSIQTLDSYVGASWPADNLIGILSMDNIKVGVIGEGSYLKNQNTYQD